MRFQQEGIPPGMSLVLPEAVTVHENAGMSGRIQDLNSDNRLAALAGGHIVQASLAVVSNCLSNFEMNLSRKPS